MRILSLFSLALGALCCGAVSASAYDVAPVKNGGTIKGKVTYDGAVPMRTVLPTKDAKVCGNVRKEALIVVGDDKGVKDVAVHLQGIEKGKAWPAADKPPVIDNKDCVFLPHVQIVPVGKVDVLNSDPVLHNTHGYYGKRTAFNIALPNQGQNIEVELKRPGTVKIDCDAHGWMLGWVYVVDNPYYSLTNEKGEFEITDIPPGKYTLVADQEELGSLPMEVEVKAGETVELPIALKK